MNIKVYRYLFLALTVAVSLLYLPIGYDYFEYPKLLGLLLFVFVIFNVFVFNNGREIFNISKPIKVLILVFIVGQLLSFVLSNSHLVSLFGARFRYQGILTFFVYLAWFLSAIHYFYLADLREKNVFLGLFGLVALMASVIALATYSGLFLDPHILGGQIYGTFGNQNYLASFLLFAGPFTLLIPNKPAKFAALIVMSIALVATGSRSSWIAVILSLLIIGFLEIKKTKKILLIGLAGILVLSLALVVGTTWHSSTVVLKRFSFAGHESESVKTRLQIWQSFWLLFKSRPLVGYGQDNIQDNIYRFLPTDITNSGNNTYVDRIHSEPLDILVTGGLLSFISYLGLLAVALRQMSKRELVAADKIMVFSVLALFFYHLVNFSTVTSNVCWYLALGYMLSYNIRKKAIAVAA